MTPANFAYTIKITDEYHCSLTVCLLSEDRMSETDLLNWSVNRFPGTETMEVLAGATLIELKK